MRISFKGSIEKLTWKKARKEVFNVNPGFAEIIDALSPDDKHWLVKVRYPYGSPVMEKSVLMLPNSKGDIVPITDSSIDSELREGIDYNLNSNPVSVVLKNAFEIFLPLEDRTIPLSGVINPGTVFGAWRRLTPEKTEHPAFIWDMTAGARSVFMLPKITEGLRHKKLEKAFGVSSNLPKTLMRHWDVFRQLANSSSITQEPWSAEILYFSKHWFNHLKDEKWAQFYQYFYHSGWAGNEFWRNQPIWNLIFSLILKDYESRPNAYVMDTAKYLLNMGAGALPGLGPVRDTTAGPFDLIQDIYTNVYDIRNYPPIIIQPQRFRLRDTSAPPVYYSLQFPNALEFKPSSRMRASVISDLHEIRSLMMRYEQELLSNRFNIGGTSLRDLFDRISYDYFHSGVELHNGMRDSKEMLSDIGLRTTLDGKLHDSFPSSCLFGKGCIRLAQK
jgi:hypothetical protein